MTTTATAPLLRPETVTIREAAGPVTLTVIRGVPGGPPKEDYIVLIRPDPRWPKGELHIHVERKKEYLRSWTTERHFVGSSNFPDGLEIGAIQQHTDTGVGQPFIERTIRQVNDDTLERLRCYAYGEPYFSITDRRRLAKESERWQQQQAAGRVPTPDTKTPDQALKELADERLLKKLDEMVEKRVAERMAAEKDSKK